MVKDFLQVNVVSKNGMELFSFKKILSYNLWIFLITISFRCECYNLDIVMSSKCHLKKAETFLMNKFKNS